MARTRLDGPGRVQLIRHMNVWIDRTTLLLINRWFRNSREMLRSLLRELVGEERLVNMTARGRHYGHWEYRPSIPEDILNAVAGKKVQFHYIFLNNLIFMAKVNNFLFQFMST